MPNTSLIKVYDAERDAGLSDLIQANASLSYVTKLEDTRISQNAIRDVLKTKASENLPIDQFDLYYINTILVSTVWNKNDDVFTPGPVWEARHTPIHKQFNLEHDQSRIIGHMTAARAVNEQYELIPDDTSIDNLPAKFHILTGAVIYKAWSDEKVQAEIDKIIEEIAAGEWYVSMECLFSGFDYAVQGKDGTSKLIARDDSSAFLTKHLRAYGGSGVYEDYKIGRCLSSIVFSGKGLVRVPANPDSIVFSGESFASFCNSGYIKASDLLTQNSNKVLTSEVRVVMANENQTQVDPKLVEAEARIKELENTIKSHESSATTAKITALTEDNAAKALKIEALEKELKSTSEASKKLVEDTSAKLTESETKLTQANAELANLKSEKVVAFRIASLLEKHAPKEDAENVVALFKDKDDAEFEKFVAILAKNWKAPAAVAPTPEVKPVVEAKPIVNLEVPAVASLTVTHDDENEALRAAMSASFASIFNPEKV